MKIDDELKAVTIMVKLYCRKKHKTKACLCAQCKDTEDYIKERLSKCPYKDNKTFCSNCGKSCYSAEMRQNVRNIMKFSGPRILISHPIFSYKHVKETITSKKEKR